MKWTRAPLMFLLCAVLAGCGALPREPVSDNPMGEQEIISPVSEQEPIQPQAGFGYANRDGEQIIVLAGDGWNGDPSLTGFVYAVGENGRAYQIAYSTFQERSDRDTGRQTMNNFENEPGCIYTLVDEAAIPNNTYLLLTEEAYQQVTVLQSTEKPERPAVSAGLLADCAELAGREIKNSWQLSAYQNGMKVSVIEFEPSGTDLLAWLVLEDGERFAYCEFPAVLSSDGYSGWRLGDQGELNGLYEFQDSLYALAAVQDARGTVFYLGWYSEETETVLSVTFFPGECPSVESAASRYIVPE